MQIQPFVSATAFAVVLSSSAIAEEYNFTFNDNVNTKDCYAMEVRIDKYLALADESLSNVDSTTAESFIRGQAYLSVAADFTRVFSKFCEDG